MVTWNKPVLDGEAEPRYYTVDGVVVATRRIGANDWVFLILNKEDGTFEEKSMRDVRGA